MERPFSQAEAASARGRARTSLQSDRRTAAHQGWVKGSYLQGRGRARQTLRSSPRAPVSSSPPSALSPIEVKCLVLQLMRAIACLHASFIIHRDIKLSNLLLTNGGLRCPGAM